MNKQLIQQCSDEISRLLAVMNAEGVDTSQAYGWLREVNRNLVTDKQMSPLGKELFDMMLAETRVRQSAYSGAQG